MSFRMLQLGCFAIAVSFGSIATRSVQAQYPYPSGPSCVGGYPQPLYGQMLYGQQDFRSGYGHRGGGANRGDSYVSNYYGSQPSYVPQPPMGYGGGYAQPAVNLNQSFYPGGYGSMPSQQYQQRPPHPSHHSHDSHHGWHLGHYLLGI
jgi:hypothetical protein